MNQRYLLSILAIAGAAFATSGCVATASDGGYYNNSGPMYGGYGSDYGRPNNSVYVQDNYGDNRYYRDRDQNRDRQAWERDRDRDARDRDARERDRQQRARDDDRRRELERQQRDRNNNRDAYGNRNGYNDRYDGNAHRAECQKYRDQIQSGSDTVSTPSRPC